MRTTIIVEIHQGKTLPPSTHTHAHTHVRTNDCTNTCWNLVRLSVPSLWALGDNTTTHLADPPIKSLFLSSSTSSVIQRRSKTGTGAVCFYVFFSHVFQQNNTLAPNRIVTPYSLASSLETRCFKILDSFNIRQFNKLVRSPLLPGFIHWLFTFWEKCFFIWKCIIIIFHVFRVFETITLFWTSWLDFSFFYSKNIW